MHMCQRIHCCLKQAIRMAGHVPARGACTGCPKCDSTGKPLRANAALALACPPCRRALRTPETAYSCGQHSTPSVTRAAWLIGCPRAAVSSGAAAQAEHQLAGCSDVKNCAPLHIELPRQACHRCQAGAAGGELQQPGRA